MLFVSVPSFPLDSSSGVSSSLRSHPAVSINSSGTDVSPVSVTPSKSLYMREEITELSDTRL